MMAGDHLAPPAGNRTGGRRAADEMLRADTGGDRVKRLGEEMRAAAAQRPKNIAETRLAAEPAESLDGFLPAFGDHHAFAAPTMIGLEHQRQAQPGDRRVQIVFFADLLRGGHGARPPRRRGSGHPAVPAKARPSNCATSRAARSSQGTIRPALRPRYAWVRRIHRRERTIGMMAHGNGGSAPASSWRAHKASTCAPAPAKAPASWAGNGQPMVAARRMVAGTFASLWRRQNSERLSTIGEHCAVTLSWPRNWQSQFGTCREAAGEKWWKQQLSAPGLTACPWPRIWRLQGVHSASSARPWQAGARICPRACS